MHQLIQMGWKLCSNLPLWHLAGDSGVLSKPVPIPGVGGDTSYLPKTCQDNWMKSTEF